MNWLSSGVHALAVTQNWRVERLCDDENSYHDIKNKGMLNLEVSYKMIEGKFIAANTQYAMGHTYSVVDLYLLVFYRWGNRLGVDMKMLYPIWTRYAKVLLERSAVVKVMDVEEISLWN